MFKSNVLKYCMTGGVGAGTTCIRLRYLNPNRVFSSDVLPTRGVDFSTKELRDKDRRYKLQLWDIASRPRERCFQSTLVQPYFNKCAMFFLCYDITLRLSFKEVDEWRKMIVQYTKSWDYTPLMVLVGNKTDLGEHRKISRKEGAKYAIEYKMLFFECSAKTGVGVKKLFESSFKQCISKRYYHKDEKLIRYIQLVCSLKNQGDFGKGYTLSAQDMQYNMQTGRGCIESIEYKSGYDLLRLRLGLKFRSKIILRVEFSEDCPLPVKVEVDGDNQKSKSYLEYLQICTNRHFGRKLAELYNEGEGVKDKQHIFKLKIEAKRLIAMLRAYRDRDVNERVEYYALEMEKNHCNPLFPSEIRFSKRTLNIVPGLLGVNFCSPVSTRETMPATEETLPPRGRRVAHMTGCEQLKMQAQKKYSSAQIAISRGQYDMAIGLWYAAKGMYKRLQQEFGIDCLDIIEEIEAQLKAGSL